MGPWWRDTIFAKRIFGVAVHPIRRPSRAQADVNFDLGYALMGKTFDDVLTDGVYRRATRIRWGNDHFRTVFAALHILQNAEVPNAEDRDLGILDVVQRRPKLGTGRTCSRPIEGDTRRCMQLHGDAHQFRPG